MSVDIDPASRNLLHELEPTAGDLLNRHLGQAKEWFPHEFVPYSQGQDFERGYKWEEDEERTLLPEAVRSALYVNLLTEDNLPYYFRQIDQMFGADGAYGTWSRRWTAEEGRHSIVIRDYLTATRSANPVELERGRMAQVSGGKVPVHENPLMGMVYVALQEKATNEAHRNTGKMIGDKAGFEVMARVAADEGLHHRFYRDLVSAAIEIDPSSMVIAMEEVVRTFEMPGTGIPEFERHAGNIAMGGIYGITEFVDAVAEPVVRKHWGLEHLTDLSPEANIAREALLRKLNRLHRLSLREQEHREKLKATATQG